MTPDVTLCHVVTPGASLVTPHVVLVTPRARTINQFMLANPRQSIPNSGASTMLVLIFLVTTHTEHRI